LGDCGAFNYVREEKPPWSPEEVLEFCSECGFDHGVSVDHVVLAYQSEGTEVVKPLMPPDSE
jgi:hypothetical protein